MSDRAAVRDLLVLSEEVAEALASRRAVVALESSLIAQGLPPPHNLETARAAEAAVREAGAVPATTAVEGGRLRVGLASDLMERLADPSSGAAKAASRDLGPLLASTRLASTTVSATVRMAHLAGTHFVATGGIGGVHRGASVTFDVSSDIDELAATPVAVVCSGGKSILDLAATLEVLESRRVAVVGLSTDELPAFYSRSSGLRLPHTATDLEQAAAMVAAHLALPGSAGILLVQPPPAELALDHAEVERWTAEALAAAEADDVQGAAVTPFLLAQMAAISGGRTLATNIGLIVNNARSAARLAMALAQIG
jgi:pseudouridine-5'-phosphate glycosidase